MAKEQEKGTHGESQAFGEDGGGEEGGAGEVDGQGVFQLDCIHTHELSVIVYNHIR